MDTEISVKFGAQGLWYYLAMHSRKVASSNGRKVAIREITAAFPLQRMPHKIDKSSDLGSILARECWPSDFQSPRLGATGTRVLGLRVRIFARIHLPCIPVKAPIHSIVAFCQGILRDNLVVPNFSPKWL